uniref:Uncharacterized protein n=1 Tax=Anguilla anguilla TaxID=7936 RepID=A0A0E9UKA8_ANGAN
MLGCLFKVSVAFGVSVLILNEICTCSVLTVHFCTVVTILALSLPHLHTLQ